MTRSVLMLTTDPDATLTEAWDALYAELVNSGAGPIQIDSIKAAYFMGAAHVWVRMHQAALAGPGQFSSIMESTYEDIKTAQGPVGTA